jgi:L-lysine 2,3-aminomutase
MKTKLNTSARPWQIALANVITDPKELGNLLNLDGNLIASAMRSHENFSLRVPRAFVARMEKGNPDDPLLKQILPLGNELLVEPGYTRDPLQEQNAKSSLGLLHKYFGRVLIIVTGGCAVHCRYCFRRHFPYAENLLDERAWDNIIDYIAADSSINEVIYSGGDPLLAKDKMLAAITEKIANIPHVKIVRLHTRLPIVIPERIDDVLLAWLTGTRLRPVVVVHVNHPNEIDDAVQHSLNKLRAANVTVLNQAVLLKGVNDNAAVLIELSYKLFSAGVVPYYLHVLDKVQGTAHFAVPDLMAQQLLRQMMHSLPGYLVPKLVREEPGALSKQLLMPEPAH